MEQHYEKRKCMQHSLFMWIRQMKHTKFYLNDIFSCSQIHMTLYWTRNYISLKSDHKNDHSFSSNFFLPHGHTTDLSCQHKPADGYKQLILECIIIVLVLFIEYKVFFTYFSFYIYNVNLIKQSTFSQPLWINRHIDLTVKVFSETPPKTALLLYTRNILWE